MQTFSMFKVRTICSRLCSHHHNKHLKCLSARRRRRQGPPGYRPNSDEEEEQACHYASVSDRNRWLIPVIMITDYLSTSTVTQGAFLSPYLYVDTFMSKSFCHQATFKSTVVTNRIISYKMAPIKTRNSPSGLAV